MRYVYRCQNGHESEVIHGMKENPMIVCEMCGTQMARKPQPFSVVWGGLKPSAGGVSPLARELIQTRAARLDDYQARKELTR